MGTLIRARHVSPVHVKGSRVICAAAVPGTTSIVAATDAFDLVCGEEACVTTTGYARGIACVKYASFAPDALPEEKDVVLALVNGAGIQIFSYPSLERVEGAAAHELAEISKVAHVFSVDSLGSDLVSESFRLAVACQEVVLLLDVNIAQDKVTILGKYTLPEKNAAVAFSEMTIVASTSRVHHLLRISRSGGLAVAATVNRSERQRRASTSTAVGGGSAAVVSFFGGLFARRGLAQGVISSVAFALPDNRWLLVVDHELVAYSSFGAKLEEMENVFRSKTGMEVSETDSVGFSSSSEVKGNQQHGSIVKSSSVSSLGSIGTAVSHRTFLDEIQANRAERPTVATIYSSPFVLSITAKNELLAFASNGSVQGVMEQVSLLDDEAPAEDGVKLIHCRMDRNLAAAYWPSGRLVIIELTDELETLIELKETEKELRSALALVPADQIDRMIGLRRLLAKEAREQEWHDAAIHHMQSVVNLSVRGEGVDQLDLVAEAIDLRGQRETGWQTDAVTATMWADFLFRLRRRVMRASAADVDVLETLCRADESSTRIKAILSVKHDIPLNTGETLITSKDSSLREEERVEALVALYTSLQEHGKALILLESSDTTSSFNGVVAYLSTSMKATDDPDTFFAHLKWLAHQASGELEGYKKLEDLIRNVIANVKDSPIVLARTFEVLVEEADSLLDAVVDGVCSATTESEGAEESITKSKDHDDSERSISADSLATALLAGMSKADSLEKRAVFDRLRRYFSSRILHHPDESYHSYTLLQALQKPENKRLGLHEELAFLLGRQGRHEAAADELAAESSLGPEEALTRLLRMLPASDKPAAADSLVAAYLRVSAQGRKLRIQDASNVLKCAAGAMDIEKVLLDGRCSDQSLSLRQMQPFLSAALVSGSDRLRTAEIIRALRKSEVRRMQEEVLTRRRRVVVVGHDRACTLCTRRIGDSVFAAYPDGSIAHLACHMSKDSRGDGI